MPFLVELAIEPRSRADSGRLGIALSCVAAEDSGFDFSRDIETGQTVIKGQSEPHLEVIVDRSIRECAINVGAPTLPDGACHDVDSNVLAFTTWRPAASAGGHCDGPARQHVRLREYAAVMTPRRGSYTIAFDHHAPIPMPPDDDPSPPAVALRG